MPVEIFSREDFENALPKGFKVYQDSEYCYRVPTDNPDVEIFIRSSVSGTGVSRGCGEDSIRCWLTQTTDSIKAPPLAKKLQRWVTRVPGWQKRLKGQIDRLNKIAQFLKPCPTCQTMMRIVEISCGQNSGRIAVSCPKKNPDGSFANHHFNLLPTEDEGEKPTCPTCGIMLREVEIRRGSNAGKKAMTCPAKDEQGNFLNHHFEVLK